MKLFYKKTATIIVLATFTSLMIFAIANQLSPAKQEESQEIVKDDNISQAPNFEEEEAIFVQNYNKVFTLRFLDKSFLTLQRLNDDKFLIEENNNKALLFIFLNDSCLQCNVQLDLLKNLEKKYKNRLMIIGIFANELDNESADAFVKNNKIPFKMSNDFEDNEFFIRALKNIDAIPYMILFKTDGNILARYKGILPSEMLESEILRVI